MSDPVVEPSNQDPGLDNINAPDQELQALRNLTSIEPPHCISSRSLAAVSIPKLRNGFFLTKQDLATLKNISKALGDETFMRMIGDNKLTIAHIKPNAFQGRGLPQNDDEAAKFLMEQIGNEKIIFTFNYFQVLEGISEFYKNDKDFLKTLPDEQSGTVWDSLVNFLTSSPLTFAVLYCESNAVEWWRNKMGATRPENADPESLRGKFALQENLPNNLFHGSDSQGSVAREIKFLQARIDKLIDFDKANRGKSALPNEVELHELKILQPDERLLVAKVLHQAISSQSALFGYELILETPNGLQTKLLRQKFFISLGDLEVVARNEYDRLEDLRSAGIPTITPFGSRAAVVQNKVLYSSFIRSDSCKAVIEDLQSAEQLPDNDYLAQLIDIAFILDQKGYRAVDFTLDLLFDDDEKQFVYSDFGWDLGPALNPGTDHNLKKLQKLFPNFSVNIADIYENKSQELPMEK